MTPASAMYVSTTTTCWPNPGRIVVQVPPGQSHWRPDRLPPAQSCGVPVPQVPPGQPQASPARVPPTQVPRRSGGRLSGNGIVLTCGPAAR